MDTIKQYDKLIGIVFLALTILFIAVAMTNEYFFNWAYDRHQNQASWFIRPIFLIPFCYFAYKRSWAGLSFTVFCLFTSMCWFSKPDSVSEDVKEFLEFEKQWLMTVWDYKKILLTATIPISFIALALAFWKRSLLVGIGVVIMMATGKIIWSIQNAGEAGKSILIPAIVGLLLCSVFIFFGFRRLEKNN